MKSIEGLLSKQQKDVSQILDIVRDVRYKGGMERISGAFQVFLKGINM
jgi:hypothetical protein